MTVTARPCKYCVAYWAEPTTRLGRTEPPPVPEPEDCEMGHRDDPRVYALAEAMAKVFQDPQPTDVQISYFLQGADDVIDDFEPVPAEWVVEPVATDAPIRDVPSDYIPSEDDEDEAEDELYNVDFRLRINGIQYVALEGEKSRGQTVRLSTYLGWHEGGAS